MSDAPRQARQPKLDVVIQPGLSPKEFRRYLATHGAKCAAWLVWDMKGFVHTRGGFDLRVESGTEEPAWFRLAIATLKARPKRWVVKTIGGTRRVFYQVRWLGWRPHNRPMMTGGTA